MHTACAPLKMTSAILGLTALTSLALGTHAVDGTLPEVNIGKAAPHMGSGKS